MRDDVDVAAFTELADARGDALFRTAYLMVGDHQLAQATISWRRRRSFHERPLEPFGENLFKAPAPAGTDELRVCAPDAAGNKTCAPVEPSPVTP